MKNYHQHCGLARALDVIGERWTLLLVRELLLAPRRYGDLLMPGLTTNLLAKRLKDLEAAGVVRKTVYRRETKYELTPRGAALEPVVMEVARWGGALLAGGPRRGDRLDPGWGLLSLKRRYLGSFRQTLEIRVDTPDGERVFELAGGPTLSVSERASPAATAVVHTTMPGLVGLVMEQAPLSNLLRSKAVRVEGERSAVEAFRRSLSPLPPRVTPQSSELARTGRPGS